MDWIAEMWGALTSWATGSSVQATDMLQRHAQSMDMAQLLALAAALGWASGIRLYAVVFATGLAGFMGWLPLPDGLTVLQHPVLLFGSGCMLFVEFLADKIPGLDSLWDVVHSVIRVPAGAALAAGVFGADSATMGVLAALLGGTLAATSYATKATARAAANTSPEPFSNITLSLFEDGLVMGMMWLATHHPVAFGLALFIVLAVSVVLLLMLIGFLRAVWHRLRGAFAPSHQPNHV
ncbi:MAG: hypothetical protein RLZZ126_719 [Pseudomonadota bacterium]|jgi:hypothetical protein